MENITFECNTTETGQLCIVQNTEHIFTPFFSSGDIMISILLSLIFFVELVKLLRKSISTTSVVRNYQGNNSPDGKEFYKL